MTIAGWVQIAADARTLEDAESLANELSTTGLSLSRAQVLRAALAVGVETIKKDPWKLVATRGRKKASG